MLKKEMIMLENTKMKDRIKEVRKEHKKSQAAFGADLGCSRDAIANYEGGRAEPPETFLQLLCSKFGINERWLRTGEGEKEAGSDDELWKKIREKFFLHGFSEEIARAWFELDDEKREDVARKVEAVASTLKAHMKEGKSAEDARKEYEAQKHAELDVALELQKKVAASSSPTIATEKRA